MRIARLFALAALYVGFLVGCGGGGDGDDKVAKAEGAYSGTLSGSISRNFQLLVLENDEYWALYGDETANQFVVRGFVQGQGTSNSGRFSSTDARDFGQTPPLSGTLSASYTPRTRVDGTFTAAGQTVSFAGSGLNSTNSSYDYDQTASLAAVVGDWTLTGLDGSVTSVSIASSGTFTGSTVGCSFSGTISPRASGKNVFNVTATSGAAPCASPGSTISGVALSYIIQGTSTRQLIVGAVNNARTEGNLFFGTR